MEEGNAEVVVKVELASSLACVGGSIVESVVADTELEAILESVKVIVVVEVATVVVDVNVVYESVAAAKALPTKSDFASTRNEYVPCIVRMDPGLDPAFARVDQIGLLRSEFASRTNCVSFFA